MISRRAVVLGSGGGLLVLTTGLFAGSSVICAKQTVADLQLDRLDVVLPDIPAASRVGQLVRERIGPKMIEEAFLARPALTEALKFDCDETRRSALRTAFSASFHQGEVLTVDRWVLSIAECAVAGLRAV